MNKSSQNDISFSLNPLCANFTKWSNTLKQFFGKLPTNCLSVFDHFVGLELKGLRFNDAGKNEFISQFTCLQPHFYV